MSMMITKHPIKRILIDNGSLIDVLSYAAFVRLNLPLDELRLVIVPLVHFIQDLDGVKGEVTLSNIVGTPPRPSTIFMTFMVV